MANIDDILVEHFRAVQAGRPSSPEELIARYPEVAAELEEFFAIERGLLGVLQPASPPPPFFGDYEIIEELARGGMGIVYRARQRCLGRDVALKVILAGTLATAEEIRRFRREAEEAAALDHPGIVPIHDIGEFDGRQYFTMKLLEGGNLAASLARFDGDPRGAAAMVETVAHAVQFAHERGVLHRDLKPSNILFDREGRAYVADFGLAKRLDADASITASGAVLGTLRYMAPEQVANERRAISTATDVYGLGLILYESLAGTGPFKEASTADLLRQIAEQDPPPPARFRPGLPRDLETIALKCLEKRPGRRYAGAGALADDLRRFLDGRPITARPVGGRERLAKWARRRPAAAALVLVSVLALATLMGVSVWHSYSLRAEAEVSKRIVQHAIYANRIQVAYESWEEGLADKANRILLKLAPGEGEEDLRRCEWHLLHGLLHQERWFFRDPPAAAGVIGERSLAFCADGKLLARLGPAGRVLFHDGGASAPAGRLAEQIPPSCLGLAFSPREALLAVAAGGRVHLYELESESRRWESSAAGTAAIADLEFTPDGRAVAVKRDGEVVLLDAQSGTVSRRIETHGEVVRLALDEPHAAIEAAFEDGAAGPVVVLRGAATQQELARLEGHTAQVLNVRFSGDGLACATGSIDRTARIWNAVDGRPLSPPLAHGASVRLVVFSPDGTQLLTGDGAGALRLWERATGKPVRTLRGHSGAVVGLAFAPDGRRFASRGADGGVKVWEGPGNPVRLEPWGVPIYAATFLPGGGSLVTGANDFTAKWWRVRPDGAAEEVGALIADPEGRYDCGALSLDGSLAVAGGKDGSVEVLRLPATGPDPAATTVVPAARLKLRDRLLCAVAFSCDAQRLVAAHEDNRVDLWRREDRLDPGRWTLERSLQLPAKMRRASYSPDDRLLALSSSDHGRVFIWELTSGQVTELPRAATGVFSTVFGPNQGLLACGHLDGTIRLWGIKTAATGVQASDQGVLEGHDQATVSLLFDSDGKTLLSAAFDGTLRIWDLVPTPDGVLGFRRAVLRGFAGPVVAMCFSPDQRTLLTSEAAPGPFPGVVKLWRLSTLEEVAARQRDDPKGR